MFHSAELNVCSMYTECVQFIFIIQFSYGLSVSYSETHSELSRTVLGPHDHDIRKWPNLALFLAG